MFGGGGKKVVKANETISFEPANPKRSPSWASRAAGNPPLPRFSWARNRDRGRHPARQSGAIQDVPIEARGTQTVADIQMVFQNPFDTLNPSMTVGSQIVRALEIFGQGESDDARWQRMLELLDLVKLPREFAGRMPRQLSGGQKQRVGIARAFAGGARIVVADEPVSALDVSVQAAVTDLLMEIQREQKTTLLFISHDLSIVRYLSDRVLVMYLGHVVELGSTDQVSARPITPIPRRCCRRCRSRHPCHQETHRAGRRHSLGDESAAGLSVPDPMPLEVRGPRRVVRARGAAHGHAGRRSPDQVPPVARGARQDGTGDPDRRQAAE